MENSLSDAVNTDHVAETVGDTTREHQEPVAVETLSTAPADQPAEAEVTISATEVATDAGCKTIVCHSMNDESHRNESLDAVRLSAKDDTPHNDFYGLVSLPQHQSRSAKKRTKMPSYNLTSDEHIEFISSRKMPLKKSKTEAEKISKGDQPKRKNERTQSKKTEKRLDKEKKAEDTSSDEPCLYCLETFSSGKWVRCQLCNKWAHYECAGIDDTDFNFVCELCS